MSDRNTGAGSPPFNLFSPETHNNPYPYYTALRNDGPIHYFKEMGLSVVSRYEEVNQVLKSPHIFSSVSLPGFDSSLFGANPPVHTRLRSILSPFFSQHRLSDLKHFIRQMAEQGVQNMLAQKEADLIDELATIVPISVIMKILGADPARMDDFKRWSQSIVTLATGMVNPAQAQQVQTDNKAFKAYLENLMEESLLRPNNSLLSELLKKEGEDGLTMEEALNFFRLLLVAGIETTTNLIGNTVLALLHHPQDIESILKEPALIPGLIEEVLRYDTPVQFVQRVVTKDIEIFGSSLPAGSMVLVLIGSANRDAAHFLNPDQFILRRNPKDHLAFGSGIHFCLGAQLARMEATIVMEELLLKTSVLKNVHPLQQVEWVSMMQVRGPKHLQLVLEKG